MYLNSIAKLELGTTKISHFILQLKVPGSKHNAGEGKKISVKVFVSWSFWGPKGAPRDPWKNLRSSSTFDFTPLKKEGWKWVGVTFFHLITFPEWFLFTRKKGSKVQKNRKRVKMNFFQNIVSEKNACTM